MSLLQSPSDCCCTPHMWNNANMTSPHDSIKLKEVWGYPECNYRSTTQESLHERAKTCPSRTLWATVFNTNSIVSQWEFWFYFGTSGKSFRMAKEVRPPGKSSHLWTWRFEPESVRKVIWTGHLYRCDLKSSSFAVVFRLFPSPDAKDWWNHPALMKLVKPTTQLWSLFQVSDVESVLVPHLNIQQNISIKCPCKTKAKMYMWTGWTGNGGKHSCWTVVV